MSLPKTGWGYGLLITLVMSAMLVFISAFGYTTMLPTVTLLLSVAILIHSPFMAVAIWRSANKYTGPVCWRWLAKGSILFIVLYVAVGLIF